MSRYIPQFKVILLAGLLSLLVGCQGKVAQTAQTEEVDSIILCADPVPSTQIMPPKSSTALRFDALGLVNIHEIDETIAINLLYATSDNFTGQVLYGDLREAYLHPEAMEALLKAQQLLKEQYPEYTLIVYDAARPMSAQQTMWDLVKGTSKNIYVSNPAKGGGLHNYGLAVDVSILDENKYPLSMGTEVDHLGYEAHITNEAELVKRGIITTQEKESRELLRRVMRGAGFRALPSEWWHFNLYSREVAKKSYKLIE